MTLLRWTIKKVTWRELRNLNEAMLEIISFLKETIFGFYNLAPWFFKIFLGGGLILFKLQPNSPNTQSYHSFHNGSRVLWIELYLFADRFQSFEYFADFTQEISPSWHIFKSDRWTKKEESSYHCWWRIFWNWNGMYFENGRHGLFDSRKR